MKALLAHHGAQKRRVKKSVSEVESQHCQLKIVEKIDLSPEHKKWTDDDEALAAKMKSKAIDISGTDLGAERAVVWQEHKQEAKTCCEVHDKKAKKEMIAMLSTSTVLTGLSSAEAKHASLCDAIQVAEVISLIDNG